MSQQIESWRSISQWILLAQVSGVFSLSFFFPSFSFFLQSFFLLSTVSTWISLGLVIITALLVTLPQNGSSPFIDCIYIFPNLPPPFVGTRGRRATEYRTMTRHKTTRCRSISWYVCVPIKRGHFIFWLVSIPAVAPSLRPVSFDFFLFLLLTFLPSSHLSPTCTDICTDAAFLGTFLGRRDG